MIKYSDFKKYMEDGYYDEIFNEIKSLVYAHNDSFGNDTVYFVSYAELDDIHVGGVTFKEQDDGLEIGFGNLFDIVYYETGMYEQ